MTTGTEGHGTTTILIVRHAEVHNPAQVLYGRLPRFRLSEGGRRQAEGTAAFLADRPVVAIYSSPLLRARQTADRIARHHPAAARRIASALHEVGTGWQGTPFAHFQPGFNAYEQRHGLGDESLEDVRDRMVGFVERIRRRHPSQTVVAVSHGDPITILRVALSGRPVTLAAIRGADYAALGSVTEIAFAPGAAGARVVALTVPPA
jgi:broad specificity phosphatase PhoE